MKWKATSMNCSKIWLILPFEACSKCGSNYWENTPTFSYLVRILRFCIRVSFLLYLTTLSDILQNNSHQFKYIYAWGIVFGRYSEWFPWWIALTLCYIVRKVTSQKQWNDNNTRIEVCSYLYSAFLDGKHSPCVTLSN